MDGIQFSTTEPLCGIRLSRDESGKRLLARIPRSSVITVLRDSPDWDGMLEFEWLGSRYAAFADDVGQRTIPFDRVHRPRGFAGKDAAPRRLHTN